MLSRTVRRVEKMRILVSALVFATVLSKASFGQGVDMQVIPPAEAQKMLKVLIPHGKKFVAFNAYVASTNVKDVNLGLRCSSSSSGSIKGTVDDDGNVNAQTKTDGSGSCREVHNFYKTMFLGLRDSADAQSGYMITVQCAEKWTWNHCDMPPEKSTYPVLLEIGKHDSFYVYAATSQKLGGKQKVAKFAVLDVTHVTPKDNNKGAEKLGEKQN
jgi:hypothetical protein